MKCLRKRKVSDLETGLWPVVLLDLLHAYSFGIVFFVVLGGGL